MKKRYRTIADLPEDLWRAVKLKACKEGRYVYEIVTEAIREKLDREKGEEDK